MGENASVMKYQISQNHGQQLTSPKKVTDFELTSFSYSNYKAAESVVPQTEGIN